jgi:hypothetical protein
MMMLWLFSADVARLYRSLTISGAFLMRSKTFYCIVYDPIPPHLSSKGKT